MYSLYTDRYKISGNFVCLALVTQYTEEICIIELCIAT